MTYEDVNIKYTDELLKLYQFNGSFPHDDLRQEKHFKLTEDEKILYTDSGLEWFPTLTGFMIHNGYFWDDEQRHYYKLTERGNLAKELKGHKNFQKHRKRESRQGLINFILAIAALLGIMSPFFLEIGKQNKWWFNETQELREKSRRELMQNMTMFDVENLFGKPLRTSTQEGEITGVYERPTVIIWHYEKYPIMTSDKSYGSPGYINFVPDRFLFAHDGITALDSTAWKHGEQTDTYRVVSYVGSFPADTIGKKWVGGDLGFIPLRRMK